MKKNIIFVIFAVFLVMVPLGSVLAAEKISYPFDNSALLMISSQMRLDGEVESADAGNGHLLSLSLTHLAKQDNNEIDILIQLYVGQIAELGQGGKHTPELEARLLNELEDKVDKLEISSEELVEVRKPRRRGLIGLFKRGLKGLGRFGGRVMGRTMEGAGKVVQFAIKEVAPEVLKKAMWGDPVSGALRSVLKEKVFKRLEGVLFRQQEKRAERGQVVLDNEDDMYQDLDDELLDPEDLLETEEAFNSSDGGGQSSDSGSGADVVVYDFTSSDAFNFGAEGWSTGWFGWRTWQGRMDNDDWCNFNPFEGKTGTIHLEFDWEAMTVSGWVQGSGEENTDQVKATGNYRVTFTDLPAFQPSEFEPWLAIKFEGEGSGTVSVGGSVECTHRNKDVTPPVDEQYWITDQASTSISMSVKVYIYKPGHSENGHPVTMIFSGMMAEVVNELSLDFYFWFDQPIN